MNDDDDDYALFFQKNNVCEDTESDFPESELSSYSDIDVEYYPPPNTSSSDEEDLKIIVSDEEPCGEMSKKTYIKRKNKEE